MRSADMIERVRSYAKRRDGRENPVDLKKVAREVVNEVGQSKSSLLRLYLRHCDRRDGIDRGDIRGIPLSMLADAGRTNRPEMRKDFSRLPCDGDCLVVGIAGNTEHDGCRRTIPRHRTTATSSQQRRNKYID